MFFLKVFSRLPFFILYRVADLVFFFAYYAAGYRKKTVLANLQKAFPEKPKAEIAKIAKGFYRNLADVLVETLKGYSMSPADVKKRVKIENPELVDENFDKGRPYIAMLSHLCNWEWVGLACSVYLRSQITVVYQELANKKFDRFMRDVRTRFGAIALEKKTALRGVAALKDRPFALGMLADQSPKRGENRLWTKFLNQDTAFFSGSEKIARKYGYPVYFITMRRVGRGRYVMRFDLIAQPPFDHAETSVTERFVAMVEQSIRENPADWLWSHKRWKLAKPSDIG